MASSDSQINKPQRRHSKRAELPGVNINTGMQTYSFPTVCILIKDR